MQDAKQFPQSQRRCPHRRQGRSGTANGNADNLSVRHEQPSRQSTLFHPSRPLSASTILLSYLPFRCRFMRFALALLPSVIGCEIGSLWGILPPAFCRRGKGWARGNPTPQISAGSENCRPFALPPLTPPLARRILAGEHSRGKEG
jgi:hypothetical protein